MKKLVFLAATMLLLGGCASTETADNPVNDPYETLNRDVFDFNMTVDRLALKPTSQTYVDVVPEGLRTAVHNTIANLRTPTTLANDILQGEGERAGITAGRFLLNTTFGIGGIFDYATYVGIEGHEEDFGQTLAVWGVGSGPYIMVPLLGPSTPRDSAGQIVDVALDPSAYLKIKRHIWWTATRQYVTIVDARSRNLEAFDTIERDSLDFYAAVRSLYLQHRASEIRNGMPPS